MMMMMMSGWVEQPFKHNHNHWLSDSLNQCSLRGQQRPVSNIMFLSSSYNETQQRWPMGERETERAMDRRHNQKLLINNNNGKC